MMIQSVLSRNQEIRAFLELPLVCPKSFAIPIPIIHPLHRLEQGKHDDTLSQCCPRGMSL